MKGAKDMKKKLSVVLVFAMLVGILTGVIPVGALASDVQEVQVKYAQNMEELENSVEVGYTETIAFPMSEGDNITKVTDAVKVEIPSDGLICFDSLLEEDGQGASWGGLHLYSNAALSKEVFSYKAFNCGKAGAPRSQRLAFFLKKGTYYAKYELFRNDAFDEDINITASLCVSGIKNSDAFVVKVTEDAGTYRLSFTNNLGELVKGLYYEEGTFQEQDIYGSGVKQLAADAESVTVTAPGTYSVILCLDEAKWDISGEKLNYVAYKVTVGSSDKTAPKITGVKNGKTYKKAVTIRFTDKDSGIASAKLNGKKIKSGTKVSANGSYKLVVTDKAGNKTTVKFKIKK